eukprot:2054620-Rhodomonas_salina.1
MPSGGEDHKIMPHGQLLEGVEGGIPQPGGRGGREGREEWRGTGKEEGREGEKERERGEREREKESLRSCA